MNNAAAVENEDEEERRLMREALAGDDMAALKVHELRTERTGRRKRPRSRPPAYETFANVSIPEGSITFHVATEDCIHIHPADDFRIDGNDGIGYGAFFRTENGRFVTPDFEVITADGPAARRIVEVLEHSLSEWARTHEVTMLRHGLESVAFEIPSLEMRIRKAEGDLVHLRLERPRKAKNVEKAVASMKAQLGQAVRREMLIYDKLRGAQPKG